MNDLNHKINLCDKIFIVGRGSLSRFFKREFQTPNNLVIGYNISKVNNMCLKFLYVSERLKKDDVQNNMTKVFNYSDINSEIENLESVGSIHFELSALIHYIDKHLTTKKPIYLYGFDFRTSSGDEDIEKTSFSKSLIQRKIDIESQKIAYRYLKNNLKMVNLVKVGFDELSDSNPRDPFLQNQIPKDNKVEVVAELTTNHFGDRKILTDLIVHAAFSGADSVKLQARDVDTFYTKEQLDKPYFSPFGKTFRDYRKQLELSDDDILYAVKLAKDYSIDIFFSALDVKSYLKLREFGINKIKLPSTISEKKDYLQLVAKNPTDEIIISTGMTNQSYIDFVLEQFKDVNKLYLLHCISSYPTFYRDVNLGVVQRFVKLSEKYLNIIPGYSSHDIGSMASIMAVAMGARMVEKHIKLGVTSWAHFDETAMDVFSEFPSYVESIRNSEELIGNGKKLIYESEHHKY